MSHKKKHTNDFGQDPIPGLVLRVSVPFMVAQFVNVFYSIADRIFIGNLPMDGQMALAGAGVCAPIVTLLSSFATLIGIGGSILFSMRLGQKNQSQAEQILGSCFSLLMGFSAALTILFLLLKSRLLWWFGASAETFPYADTYLTIYTCGTFFALLSAGMNYFITAQGFPALGMATTLIGAVLNLILDPVFLFGLDLGIAGAAVATVIAQIASCTFVLLILRRKSMPIPLHIRKPSRAIVQSVVSFGFSPFLILATDSILLIALNAALQYHGGTQGDMLITCATIAQSYLMLITSPMIGITGGSQPLISFNYGAARPERIHQTVRCVLTLCICFTGFMFVLSRIVPEGFVRIFTSDTEQIHLSSWAIRTYTLMIVPLAFQYTFVDSLTALGKPKVSLTLSLFRKTLYFSCACLLPFAFGATSSFYAEPIADGIAAVASTTTYLMIMKMHPIAASQNNDSL